MRPQSDLFECALENENKYQAVEVEVDVAVSNGREQDFSYVLFIS